MNQLNYASLEASKRLVDAGIVIKSEKIWASVPNPYNVDREGNSLPHWKLIDPPLYPYKEQIPAPSMTEVWRELPEGFEYISKFDYESSHAYLCLTKSRKGDNTTFASYFLPDDKAVCGSKKHDANPTDALIDLLVWVRKEQP